MQYRSRHSGLRGSSCLGVVRTSNDGEPKGGDDGRNYFSHVFGSLNVRLKQNQNPVQVAKNISLTVSFLRWGRGEEGRGPATPAAVEGMKIRSENRVITDY
ncbi:hypothetical protein E2C01_061029 [Portunus trituberculatus]|uniref:Uncharacterized protein n=1 Tax=Portunus trituberculatus TaxID=210409 RepID=A0A5B7HDY9_PORTR|nr:hypothetical protein [Portunus trituberculatus]